MREMPLPEHVTETTHALHLDLKNGDDLKEIAQTPQLRILHLENAFKIENLDALSSCTELEELSIQSAYSLEDLTGLEHLPLKRLRLRTGFKHLKFPVLPPLDELSLVDCKLDGLPELSAPSKLQTLNLDRSDVRSIQSIGCYPELEHLSLRWGWAPNLDSIQALKKLRVLDLRDSRIADVRATAHHPSLRVICSSGARLTKAAFPRSVQWCVTTEPNPDIGALAQRTPPLKAPRSTPKGSKIKRFLNAKDRETVEQGIELLRTLNAGWDEVLDGVIYDPHAKRTVRSKLKGTAHIHATLAVLNLAPKNNPLAQQIRAQIARLRFERVGNAILELSPWTFSGYPKLKEIELSWVDLDHRGAIPKLPALSHVFLDRIHGTQDLTWLSGAQSLLSLKMSNFATSLKGLAGLSLETLKLERVHLADAQITGLQSLRTLQLDHPPQSMRLSSQIGVLPSLQRLEVSSSLRPDDLSFLARLPRLQTLQLNLREVTDFDPIYQHSNLKNLRAPTGFGGIDRKRIASKGITLKR